jgi:hypothetical protein
MLVLKAERFYMRNMRFFWFISLLLGIVSNMFFYTPIVYYALKIKNEESETIEFVNFILSYNIFLLHAIAAAIAFAAFLLAVSTLFQRKIYRAVFIFIISSAVIVPYLMGYKKIFLFLFSQT